MEKRTLMSPDVDSKEQITQYKLTVCPTEEPTTYSIRAMSMEYANLNFERYAFRNFLIYYKLSQDNVHNVNSIPLSIPLMIACNGGKDMLHAQVKCYVWKDGGDTEELWCAAKLGADEKPRKEPYRIGYPSVNSLLEYHSSLNANCAVPREY